LWFPILSACIVTRRSFYLPLLDALPIYQILGAAPGGEMEVLLVAIKTDIVEGLFRIGESRGVRLQGVDVSPAALANAFRFNYSEDRKSTRLNSSHVKISYAVFCLQ